MTWFWEMLFGVICPPLTETAWRAVYRIMRWRRPFSFAAGWFGTAISVLILDVAMQWWPWAAGYAISACRDRVSCPRARGMSLTPRVRQQYRERRWGTGPGEVPVERAS